MRRRRRSKCFGMVPGEATAIHAQVSTTRVRAVTKLMRVGGRWTSSAAGSVWNKWIWMAHPFLPIRRHTDPLVLTTQDRDLDVLSAHEGF
jgi:hypothetical protein